MGPLSRHGVGDSSWSLSEVTRESGIVSYGNNRRALVHSMMVLPPIGMPLLFHVHLPHWSEVSLVGLRGEKITTRLWYCTSCMAPSASVEQELRGNWGRRVRGIM